MNMVSAMKLVIILKAMRKLWWEYDWPLNWLTEINIGASCVRFRENGKLNFPIALMQLYLNCIIVKSIKSNTLCTGMEDVNNLISIDWWNEHGTVLFHDCESLPNF